MWCNWQSLVMMAIYIGAVREVPPEWWEAAGDESSGSEIYYRGSSQCKSPMGGHKIPVNGHWKRKFMVGKFGEIKVQVWQGIFRKYKSLNFILCITEHKQVYSLSNSINIVKFLFYERHHFWCYGKFGYEIKS